MIAAIMIVMVMLPTMHARLADVCSYSEEHIAGSGRRHVNGVATGMGDGKDGESDDIKYNNNLLLDGYPETLGPRGWLIRRTGGC